MHEDILIQDFSCCLVPAWKRKAVLCKLVRYHQDILESTFRRLHLEEVHTQEFHRLGGGDVN